MAEVLGKYAGVTDANVYGVKVPRHEGRAGMAAVSANDHFVLRGLTAHLTEHLPIYAHPLFVRLANRIDVTGTFKLMKGQFVFEGYTDATDPVWFNDRSTGRFIMCDAALVQAIDNGKDRL